MVTKSEQKHWAVKFPDYTAQLSHLICKQSNRNTLSAQRGSFCFFSELLYFYLFFFLNISMKSIINYLFSLSAFISDIQIVQQQIIAQTLIWNGKPISTAESSRGLCWDVHTAEVRQVHFSDLRFHTKEENRKRLPTAEASSNPFQGEKFEFLNVKILFQTIFVLSVILQRTPKWGPWAALTVVSI